MFLLRDMLDLSYPNIGDRMGKRDHTTALYAFERQPDGTWRISGVTLKEVEGVDA